MTGLRVLSYIFLVAGVGSLVLLGVNAVGLELMGDAPARYFVPGATAKSAGL